MAKKERSVIVKVIENKNVNTHRLAEYFARKYSEKDTKQKS